MLLLIKNWKKFNPRNDVKSSTWFRLEHGLFNDHELADLEKNDFIVWFYILSIASQKSSDRIEINFTHVKKNSRVSEKEFRDSIEVLQRLSLVTVDVTHTYAHVTSTLRPRTHTDTTNERDETNVTNERDDNVEPEFDASALFNLWNENCGSLPKSRELSKTRKSSATARLKEKPERLFWEEVIFRIRDSAFCNGESDTGWRATFDWLLKPDTHMKVLEGKYDKIKKEPANIDGLFRKSSA